MNTATLEHNVVYESLRMLRDNFLMEIERLKAQRIAEANVDAFDGLADRFFQLAAVIEADLKAPDITNAVNFTDELTAIEKLQREIEQIADKFGTGSAGSALYGDWNPAEHIPADPSVMSQAGWVCNSKRAAIKAAYEKQLHKDYNALWTK